MAQLYAYEAPPPPSFVTNGLVAYYPFNGNANDQSGNHYDGLVVGAELAPDRFGVSDRAYDFSQPGSYIQVPIDFMNSQKVTVSAWIKMDTKDSAQAFFTRDDFERGISLWYSPSGYFQFAVGGSRGFVGATYSNTPALLRWYFLTGTYDGTAIKLFLDGVEVASQDYVDGIYYLAGGKNWIGNDSLNPSNMLLGNIDDVRIYNRALSDAEVQQLYVYESQAQPCVPHRATATATVVNGFVVGMNITDGGCGYTNSPVVEILGNGTGATATATVANGVVTSITVTDAGTGYTSAPNVAIASPPFTPWVNIAVTKVSVTMHVLLGNNYVLESSIDLKTWTQVGPIFTAQDETITQEFDVDVMGRYYQVRQVP